MKTNPLSQVAPLVALFISIICSACGEKSKIQTHLEAGEKFFQEGNYDGAKIEFLNLQKRDPKNAAPYARLGEIWLSQGSPYKAVPYLLHAAKLSPDDPEICLHLAQVAIALDAWKDARKYVAETLSKDPDNEKALIMSAETSLTPEQRSEARALLESKGVRESVGALLGLGILEIREGDLAAAAGHINKALAKSPDSATAHYMLGLIKVKENDAEGAEEAYRIAAGHAVARGPEKIFYARFLLQAGKVDEAVSYLESVVETVPDFAPAWVILAEVAFGRQEYDKTSGLLENILRRDGSHLEARLLQAQVQRSTGAVQASLDNLKQLKGTHDNSVALEYNLAVAYLMSGIPTAAQDALARALKVSPGHIEARLLKARLDLRSGETGSVVASMEQLIEQFPNLVQAQLLLADAYRKEGRPQEAASIFEETLKSAPDDVRTLTFLGVIRRQQGLAEEARELFEKAVALDSGAENSLGAFPIYNLTELDVVDGQIDKAKKRMEGLSSKFPNEAGPHLMLGRIHIHEKDWDQAVKSLEKAIALNENMTQAYDLLISVFVTTKKLPEARVRLEELVEAKPDDLSGLIRLALVRQELNDYEGAASLYKRAIAQDPNFASALNNLAWLYVDKMGDLEKALEMAQQARALAPNDGGVADTLGWIYYQQKDYQRAIGLLREASASLSDSPEVHYHLGMAAYMMGRSAEARAALAVACGSDLKYEGKDVAEQYLARLMDQGSGEGLSEEQLRAAIQAAPDDVLSLLQLGELLSRKDDKAGALEIYEKILVLSPTQIEALVGAARLTSDPDRARELATSARSVAPNDGRPLALLGKIAMDEGKSAQALALLGEAVAKDGAELGTHRNYAWVAYQSGQLDAARQSMGKVVEGGEGPWKAEATNFMALTDSERPQAERLLLAAKVLQADPEFLPALMTTAASHQGQGEWAKSVAIYQAILSDYSDFTPAKKELAIAYLNQGENFEEAKRLAQEVREQWPDDLALAQTLGAISYHLEEFRYAVLVLKQVDQKNALDAFGLYYLGASQVAQDKDDPSGKESLQRALSAGLEGPMKGQAEKLLANFGRVE